MSKETTSQKIVDNRKFAEILACAICPDFDICNGVCIRDKERAVKIILEDLEVIDKQKIDL